MRSHFRFLAFPVVWFLTLGCLPAQDSAATLFVLGDVKNPDQWSIESLKTQFADQVQDIKFVGNMDKAERIGGASFIKCCWDVFKTL